MVSDTRSRARGFARTAALILMLGAATATVDAQDLSDRAVWAAELSNRYGVIPDIIYSKANNFELRLDLYLPRGHDEGDPLPTLMYIHGGGWIFGAKEGASQHLLPYLEDGWAAVNVGYRLSNTSHAPAAVEDVRCALRWVIDNADSWNLDPERIVVTGHSAGGHLSLATGLLTDEAGLDAACPGGETPLEVAAVINWFGITDVPDLLEGPNEKNYAVAWLGSRSDRRAVAERVSPIYYVRASSPPVLTIHGDEDTVVPYSHATRLHEKLDAARVPNRLVTIEGGGHGQFTDDEVVRAYGAIRDFLQAHVK